MLIASAFSRRQTALAGPSDPDRNGPDPFAAVEHSLGGRIGVAGQLSLKELCQAVVEVSDYTAANTLLRYLGGPRAITAYARHLGDPSARLDRVELSLNSNLPGDPRDTTTPAAMIETMRKVLIGDALSGRSRDLLIDWLKNCQTGLQRLRAGLPAGSSWRRSASCRRALRQRRRAAYADGQYGAARAQHASMRFRPCRKLSYACNAWLRSPAMNTI
jgi:hypothetical protein